MKQIIFTLISVILITTTSIFAQEDNKYQESLDSTIIIGSDFRERGVMSSKLSMTDKFGFSPNNIINFNSSTMNGLYSKWNNSPFIFDPSTGMGMGSISDRNKRNKFRVQGIYSNFLGGKLIVTNKYSPMGTPIVSSEWHITL